MTYDPRVDAAAGRPPRAALLLAWSVPVCLVASALLPIIGGPAGTLFGSESGTLVFQVIWLVWSIPLAAAVGWLARAGRTPGPVWAVLQTAILLLLLAGDLPPVLQAVAPQPVERFAADATFLVLPFAVLLLSAVEGAVLFLRA